MCIRDSGLDASEGMIEKRLQMQEAQRGGIKAVSYTHLDVYKRQPGQPTVAYILDAQGHLNHVFGARDDGTTLWCHTEPGRSAALLAWLRRMVFAARVEIADVSADHALVLPPRPTSTDEGDAAVEPGGDAPRPASVPAEGPVVVPRDQVDAMLGDSRAGLWAMEALRIESGTPRVFLDTDEKTIPNELANPEGDQLGEAVHLRKGCYPGQETVARIHNLGRPPRRLTLLHLDGSVDRLPEVGADVMLDGRVVGPVSYTHLDVYKRQAQ